MLAAERLEAAVERLADALEAWRTARLRQAEAAAEAGGTVSRAELEALSAQLDDTLVRLRGALDEPEA